MPFGRTVLHVQGPILHCNCHSIPLNLMSTKQQQLASDIETFFPVKLGLISGLQTYPNLHPPPPVGPSLGCLPRGGANLCRFVPVQSTQTRAWAREFVHVCFGLLGRLVQVGANLDGFGAL